MKAYIYTMFPGADPGMGWKLNDPIFGAAPTLGACVPNIRRAVVAGDHIFVISGRTSGVRQYIVGGFQVAEKISALAAYGRFPDLRQRVREDGTLNGNIIVTPDGRPWTTYSAEALTDWGPLPWQVTSPVISAVPTPGWPELGVRVSSKRRIATWPVPAQSAVTSM